MRKISGLLQIVAGLLNIHLLVKYVLYMAKFDSLDGLFPSLNFFFIRGHFDFIDFLHCYYLVIGTAMSAIILFITGINTMKGKHWGLSLMGGFLMLVTSAINQRLDLAPITQILCYLGLILGILSIILTIKSKNDHQQTYKDI
jgi:hypothetical protein